MEQQGRLEDAVRWASAAIADEFSFSSPDKVSSFLLCLRSAVHALAPDSAPQSTYERNDQTKIRAGRVLGRCHAALGQPSLSVTALDAGLQLAKTARLVRGSQLPRSLCFVHL